MSSDDFDGPLLIISSDFSQFDPDQLQRYRDEGYRVHYVENADVRAFQRVADEIEPGEAYGIIAFGKPALHALKFTCEPIARLKATVAYYPPAYISPQGARERGVRVVVHTVGQTGAGGPGPGFGELGGLGMGLVGWVYGDGDEGGEGEGGVNAGFAEQARGKGVYRRVEAELAMARDLDVIRSSVGGGMSGVQVEQRWEDFLGWLFRGESVSGKDFEGNVSLHFGLGGNGWGGGGGGSGGVSGGGDVDPEDFLGPRPLAHIRSCLAPPGVGFRMRLLRRTVGVNSVVDEVVVRFRHVRRMEWIIPGVEGTGREVAVGMVVVGGLKGGKVVRCRVGWDRGEVRRQVGDGVRIGEKGERKGMGDDGKSEGRRGNASEMVHLAK
ncbi:hypothetical protein EV426DRAFT_672579 [Tirmania nivea]|nr:hypothetical protein EV426DRAFT_672579 [Tirmania nivea]